MGLDVMILVFWMLSFSFSILKNILKDIETRGEITNQHELIDIYEILHSTTTDHTFISSAHRIFPKKGFIQGRKRSLNLEGLKLYDVCSRTKIELN